VFASHATRVHIRFLLIAQLSAVICIRSDPVWARLTVGIMILCFVLLFNHFAFGFKKAFPNFAVHVFPIFAMASFNPWVWKWMWGSSAREHEVMMRHNAETMIQDAENNYGKAVVNKVRAELEHERHGRAHDETHEHSGGCSESARILSSPGGLELQDFLASTLPDTAPKRRQQLAIGMLIEEMTVPNLAATCRTSMVVLGMRAGPASLSCLARVFVLR
jgi:hypothetical protein